MTPNTNQQTMLYALDFDGVICDSALELALSGWQVGRKIWLDMPERFDEEIVEEYRIVRPAIETGYESIPIMRLLQQGKTAEEIIAGYDVLIPSTIKTANTNISILKQMFGDFRDQWINKDEASWLNKNPIYPGISNHLAALEGKAWYIITTKQERFAQKILEANDIFIPTEHIFGMDRNMSKQEVLEGILEKHDLPVTFVEDRFKTLTGILKNPALSYLNLKLANWGYNTEEDRKFAHQKGIEVISTDRLIVPED